MNIRSVILKSFFTLAWIILIFSVLYIKRAERLEGGGKDAITVFCWSDLFDDSVIEAFEKETGIQVNFNTYTSNEELIVKLKATGGKGYDVIIPSDYAVRILRESDLIKEIDTNKIETFKDINPALRGHAFDPNNTYSVPYCWEMFGLVYDPAFFEKRAFLPSWDMIFDPKKVEYTIAMINDPVEAFIIAAFYKYGPIQSLNEKQIKGVQQLLTIQKNWVEAYGAMRTDYFVSMKNCPLGVTTSSYALLAQSQFPFVEFAIAKPYTFVTIENMCIPKASSKDEQVYAFMNYVLKPENYAKAADEYFFFPPSDKIFRHISKPPRSYFSTYKEATALNQKFYFIKNVTDEETMRRFWIDLKAL